MSWYIRFPKDQIARSREMDSELVAIGWYGAARAEAFMHLTEEQVATLWHFAHEMSGGKAPADALAEAERLVAESKARIAARKAAREATPSREPAR